MLIDNIFIDTSAWVALADSDDINHKKAAAIYPTLLKKHRSLFTTNLIVAETYILILRALGHEAAIKFIENINASIKPSQNTGMETPMFAHTIVITSTQVL